MGITVLNSGALNVADNLLKIGGTLVMKTLQGTLEHEFFVLKIIIRININFILKIFKEWNLLHQKKNQVNFIMWVEDSNYLKHIK